VNYEASSAKLADKMPTRIGMMTGITLDRRVNVANAANALSDFSVILAHSLSPAMMINICALCVCASRRLHRLRRRDFENQKSAKK
jgi:hypothetical protein